VAEVGEPAALGGGRLEPDEAQAGGQSQLGDGVRTDDGPPEPGPVGRTPLEAGPIGAPARGRTAGALDLDDHGAIVGQEVAAAAQEALGIAADADVPVGEEDGAPRWSA